MAPGSEESQNHRNGAKMTRMRSEDLPFCRLHPRRFVSMEVNRLVLRAKSSPARLITLPERASLAVHRNAFESPIRKFYRFTALIHPLPVLTNSLFNGPVLTRRVFERKHCLVKWIICLVITRVFSLIAKLTATWIRALEFKRSIYIKKASSVIDGRDSWT